MRVTIIPLAVTMLHVAVAGSISPLSAQTGRQVVSHVLEEPGWVGITPDSLNPLVVGLVAAGTPAAWAGILPGDRIVSIDGGPATARRLYQRLFPIGEVVQLAFERGSRRFGTFSFAAVENPYAAYYAAQAREDSVRQEARAYRVELARSAGSGRIDSPIIILDGRIVPVRPTSAERARSGQETESVLTVLDGKVSAAAPRQRPPSSPSQSRVGPPSTDTLARLFASYEQVVMQLREAVAVNNARATGLVARIGSRTAIAGAEVATLNEGLAVYFGGVSGVLVLNVPRASPAADAGLRSGDVIERVNQAPVQNIMSLLEAVGQARGAITLAVLRAGERVSVPLRR